MVNIIKAFQAETKVLERLNHDRRTKKYRWELHPTGKYGVDIQATAEAYLGLAIEVESCDADWGPEDPWPPTWKNGFTVPSRKHKFFEQHPLSIYIKVNTGMTRAVVAPLAFICASPREVNGKSVEGAHKNFKCQDFFTIVDPQHPAVAYIRMEDLSKVVDEQFKCLMSIKKVNATYTDKSPIFKERVNA